MNQLDKLVAQKNGSEAKLPPFHRYLITFEPQGNEHVEIVREGSLVFAVIKHRKGKKKFVIDTNYLQFHYNFYYDDPEETEEERLGIIDKISLNDEDYRKIISDKINFYEPKAHLTFKKCVNKLDYSYRPLSEPLEETEGRANEAEEQISEVPTVQEPDKPSNTFLQRVKQYIKK